MTSNYLFPLGKGGTGGLIQVAYQVDLPYPVCCADS